MRLWRIQERLHTLAPPQLRQGAQVALLAALIFAAWHFFGATDIGYDAARATPSAFVWLWRRWMGEVDTTWFATSIWVPALFLLMVWTRRRDLQAAAGPTSRLGLAVVVLALALHWMGARAQQTRLSLAAFALLLWAIPYYLTGPAVARRLAFPCSFLLLAMPLNFLDGLTLPLRWLAVKLAALLLGGLGLNVTSGTAQVYSRVENGFHFDLADAASGIYPLAALGMLLLTIGFLRRWPWWRLAAWLALLPLVFVLANAGRTVLFGLGGEAFGPAAASAAFGRWSPAFLLVIALALLGSLAAAERRLRTRLAGRGA